MQPLKFINRDSDYLLNMTANNDEIDEILKTVTILNKEIKQMEVFFLKM